MKITPYLMFKGQCKEAFEFYENALGGKIIDMIPHRGTPACEHVPEEWQDKILHASLAIGDNLLMGSDSPPEYQEQPQGISVTIGVTDPAEAEQIFEALSPNAVIKMPIQETFWAKRFAMLVDQYGIPWMINCSKS